MKTTTTKPKTKKPLTPAQMRVAIAKDVILQIKSEKYKPHSGVYIDREVINPDGDLDQTNVKKFLSDENATPCKVCAIGSALLSGLNLFNNIIVKNSDPAWKKIETWFESRNAFLMEEFFERRLRTIYPHPIKDEPDSTKRLVRIMKNIIKNKGTFCPSKEVV